MEARVVQIAGSFEDEGLEAFATGLGDAGVVCQCWHFCADRRVVLSVHEPQERLRLDVMRRLVTAAGARLL